jgi:hypothetical protein
MSVSVPRRGTETESPVVARKALSWGWSEGVTSSGGICGATRQGRHLMEQAKPCSRSKRDVWEADTQVKANQGAAGVDGPALAAVARDLANHL